MHRSAFERPCKGAREDMERHQLTEREGWRKLSGVAVDELPLYGNVQVEIGSNDDVMFRGENRSSVHLGLCCLLSC